MCVQAVVLGRRGKKRTTWMATSSLYRKHLEGRITRTDSTYTRLDAWHLERHVLGFVSRRTGDLNAEKPISGIWFWHIHLVWQRKEWFMSPCQLAVCVQCRCFKSRGLIWTWNFVAWCALELLSFCSKNAKKDKCWSLCSRIMLTHIITCINVFLLFLLLFFVFCFCFYEKNKQFFIRTPIDIDECQILQYSYQVNIFS